MQRASARGVSGLVAERVDAWLGQLRGAARATDHDRLAARHRFGDHQSERFGVRARVHDDVERAHRRGGVLHEAGESDA